MDEVEPTGTEGIGEQVEQNAHRVDRRAFLKTSAVGVGLLAVPGVACTGTGSDNGGSSTTTTSAQPPTPVPAPDPSTALYATQGDTWVEPWEFVQARWPGEELTLDVVEHASPVALFGDIGTAQDANVGQFLFSWNGISPAPTMRIRGNDILHVRVRNMLGPNDGVLHIPTGEVPPIDVATPADWISGGWTTATDDFCRPIHTNHKHQIRTTNIHFHGSHVTPYQNTDGSHSDDIFLRIIPQDDLELRQTSEDPNDEALQNPVCWPLKGSEVVGQAGYQYRLGSSGGARETHPPGTHWYHPHAHGSTFTQVASGMAGMIIVEGDVDDALNDQLRDKAHPLAFNERPIVLQRIVGPAAVDLEETFARDGQVKSASSAVFGAVNGQSVTSVENYIVLAPEVVERWRVLNAGVDGQAYIDFMVLDLVEQDDLTVALATSGAQTIRWISRASSDPVTLTITVGAGGAPIEWTREQNGSEIGSGSEPEIIDELYAEIEEYQYVKTTPDAYLRHLASDGITLVNEQGEYHSRPVTSPHMLSPANRADFLFQAPALDADASPRVLSMWIRQTLSGADAKLASKGAAGTKFLQRIATLITRGTPTPPPPATDLNNLAFPPVPGYLLPVTDEEITVTEGDPDYDAPAGKSETVNNGKRRTRRVVYSGWGGGSFPVGKPPNKSNRSNQLLAYNGNPQGSFAQTGGVSAAESMMIDGRKFNDDPDDLGSIGHHMLVGTAEEWTVSNVSMTLFPSDPNGPPGDIDTSYDNRQAELGNEPYATVTDKATLQTRAVDHPFHIHINPCWVTGLFDWAGRRLNWNYELDEDAAPDNKFFPRWHDVMRLPRMGGSVSFRSRFWDFTGEYVNHCHILQHEDNGMMQGIAVVIDPDQADYVAMDPGQSFRPPTWHECYTLDWGVGGDAAQAAEERALVDEILADLSTPVNG